MPKKKPFEPNFRTPEEDLNKNEQVKKDCGLEDDLHASLRDFSNKDIALEAEQVAKSHGIYLEFDRSEKKEKHWMYMVRISIPGGGPINKEQWRLIDDLSEKYTAGNDDATSIRLTTRQNIQFHWLDKKGVLDMIKTLAENDLRSLNGCGDNTRNVMATPMSRFCNTFNGIKWAHKVGAYFQLPVEPYIKVFEIEPDKVRQPGESFDYGPRLLNRKYKIGFSGFITNPETGELIPDNSSEILTNDTAVAPILEDGKVNRFQIYVGGGQGERNGKPSMATLGLPLGIIPKDKLVQVLDAIVHVHQEWGDRQNRHWARVKYVVKKMGIEWYRKQVEERLGFKLDDPNPDHDYGDRKLYHGWQIQPSNGLLAYGVYLENGRITDAGPNGKLKTMIRNIFEKYPVDAMITANQDLLFCNIPLEEKENFENDLKSYGYGQRNREEYSTLRLNSGACVGRDTCRLTYTDSEKFEPELIDELEKMGWGDLAESIGITGCERQCFRPSTKSVGLIGTGLNRYQLRLFGDEAGRHQGRPLISSDGENMYLRMIPREEVANVLNVLFKFYTETKQDGEDLGKFTRRLGPDAIIEHFRNDDVTGKLMEKPFNTACVMD